MAGGDGEVGWGGGDGGGGMVMVVGLLELGSGDAGLGVVTQCAHPGQTPFHHGSPTRR